MTLPNLWDYASGEVENEATNRKMATAKAATAGVWEFLAAGTSERDFANRVALMREDLSREAAAAGVGLDALVADYARQHGLILEATRKQAAAQCACGHASLHHADGGKCPTCGCDQFRATAEAAKTAKGFACEDCGGVGSVPAGGWEDPKDVEHGQVRCPSCQGSSTSRGWGSPHDADERTSDERYGDSGDYYRGGDAGDAQDDWYRGDYYASLKTALPEGEDPLAWLEGQSGAPGAPEKPGGHQDTGDASEGPSAGQQVQGSRRPF